MAEIAGGFLGPALEVVKWVSAPILRQFNYLCCFSANITSLKNEAEILQDAERDLQGKVDAARNDVRLISSTVETWLKKSKEIKDETDGILNEVPNVEGGCLKLRARFSLSRRAKKTTDRLKELRDQCKFNDNSISLPGPPPATKAVPSESSYEFKSRKQIEEDIMTTLGGEDVKMIGIWGMGGLGKTTMAKRIMNRALEEHVLEEVAMAVVSQPIDKLKIQLDIAGPLGLKLEGKSPQANVQKLHERLSGTKRTLVILDDVWDTFKLEDLGIPHAYKGCTILLTSRSRDVLSRTNVQTIFGMELLSEEESWFLFKEKVGTHADDTKLHSIAKEVMNECGRLPIALITVGAALKDKVNVSAWKNALRQLKRHDPDIPDFIKKVYNPLELSYDVLEHKYQLVFLLCCLYPEDADIPLERLTYFCIGLRLFEGGMVEERDRIEGIEFPLLRRIWIKRCRKLKGMSANGVTNNENSGGTHHFFCESRVSFGCLKELDYDRNPFCSHTIHVSIFDRLEVLNINGYNGSMSLFSSSITGNLVNLTTLTISNCDKMVKVIEEKEEEKEKVVSGAQRTTILFPKLHKIELWYLPELVVFCEWKCDVELPSLTEVEIDDCDNMKSFTLGPLNTPKLESVRIDGEEFGGVKDLNGLVQQQYINRTEEKQAEEAEKKKGGEEEQERKGETEEEQN